jgi:transcriptional regulator with XRE-family HTH domain
MRNGRRKETPRNDRERVARVDGSEEILNLQGRVALLQFVPITLKALKPKATKFESRTLGQHVKLVRRTRGLSQRAAATLIRVSAFTVLNWETGKSEPRFKDIPAILQFLGYDPFPKPATLGEHLLAICRHRGWSITTAAKRVGLDPATWAGWEAGKAICHEQHRQILGTNFPEIFPAKGNR